MASYAYGGLLVRVTGDTRPLAAGVAADAVKIGNDAGQKISRSITGSLGKAAKATGRGAATALGSVTLAATAFGVAAFKTAARVGEMDASLRALAKANKLSYPQMQATVTQIRKQGIEAGTAQTVVAEFAKGHINLAKATKLATVAQDSAVISGRNSTEVLNDLIHGIVTQQTDVLRTAGINIDVAGSEAIYAKSIGKTVTQLTASQKQTAILNAVLTQGKTVAGAYAAAMEEPGKVLRSFPRIINDIQVSVGQGLVKAFGPVILKGYQLAKAIDAAVAPGGALAPIFDAIGASAAKMFAPLSSVIDLTTKWLDGLKPGQLDAMTASIQKFAPEIAAAATALGAFAGGQYLQRIPVLGEAFGALGGPIGIVVTGLATLALTSPDARAALGDLVGTLTSGLAPVMKELAPAIGQLGLAVGVILTAAIKGLLPLVPALVTVLEATLKVVLPLVPAITYLSNLFAEIAPVLVPLIAAWLVYNAALTAYEAIVSSATIATLVNRAALAASAVASAAQTAAIVALYTAQYVVRAATLAWTAAQWLLNAALDANPIGLVIIALAALAAGLIIAWQKSAAFRDIVIAAWNAVRGAVLTAIHAITSNVGIMMRVLLAVITGGMSEVVRTVVTHWATITSTISRAWSGLVSGARTAGGAIVNGLKSGITSAVSGIGSWIKKSLVDPIIGAVKHFFGVHSPSTVFEGIGSMLTKGLFLGMVPGLSGLGNLVGTVFGGMPQALAGLIGKGMVGLAGLPAKALNAVTGLMGKTGGWLGGVLGKVGGLLGGFLGTSSKVGSGVNRWAGTVRAVLATIGRPDLFGLVMSQMQSESGGNQFAQNNWDSNAKAGIPSKGLMQVIPPTFAAYAGPYAKLGIFNAFANIYAAVRYAISRYGASIFRVLGHGHGYASGGVISEPVTGFGHHSGQVYHIAERGPELVSPLTGRPASMAGVGAAGAVINVYPSAGMDERQLAAMVSRELAWATAGGIS